MDEKNKKFHPNNFDFIRIMAALAVLYSHHFALLGRPEPSFLNINTLGGAAVSVFFSISGYLVVNSWYNDPHLVRFALKRVLRIWPGLIAVVLITAFFWGPMLSSLNLKEYFSQSSTFEYTGWIWLQESYLLAGVYEDNHFKNVMNGSLWTIPLEVKCYLVLGILGFLGVLKSKRIFLLLIAFYLIIFLFKYNPDFSGKNNFLLKLGAYFSIGIALSLTEKIWLKNKLILAFSSFAILFVLQKFNLYQTSGLFFIPVLVIVFGVSETPVISSFGKYGDPSYGIYLYAFPIQQYFIMNMLPEADFYLSMFYACVVTLIVAYVSWHVIEKNALKLKPKRKLPKSLV